MERGQTRRRVLTTAGVAVLGTVAGCSDDETSESEPVDGDDDATHSDEEQTATDEEPTTADIGVDSDGRDVAVGSKRFTENVLLGEMSASLLSEVDGVASILDDSIGERTTVQSFVDTEYGGLDHYWEYTGTLFRSHYAHESPETLEEVRELAADDDVAVLEPGGFDNTYELVTTDSFATTHGLETLTDLADKLENSDVRLGLGDEFVHRIDGWRGFVDAYDVDADRANEVTSEAVVVPAGDTYGLLEEGEVDVVMGFSTDPELGGADVIALEDDRSFFPAYNPVALVHRPTLEAVPEIEATLNDLASHLDSTETMRELIARVDDEGEDPSTVATAFLEEVL
ncbi:glycine betaine ABC transporter substrate-binding protein [Natrarchaeobius sp. A-rgal3]|uniref:ABC transporter substrate-binding protein n=1 Tax=Natrarchaeobius versutus TaxID=1679078 RepID=UPI0035107886